VLILNGDTPVISQEIIPVKLNNQGVRAYAMSNPDTTYDRAYEIFVASAPSPASDKRTTAKTLIIVADNATYNKYVNSFSSTTGSWKVFKSTGSISGLPTYTTWLNRWIPFGTNMINPAMQTSFLGTRILPTEGAIANDTWDMDTSRAILVPSTRALNSNPEGLYVSVYAPYLLKGNTTENPLPQDFYIYYVETVDEVMEKMAAANGLNPDFAKAVNDAITVEEKLSAIDLNFYNIDLASIRVNGNSSSIEYWNNRILGSRTADTNNKTTTFSVASTTTPSAIASGATPITASASKQESIGFDPTFAKNSDGTLKNVSNIIGSVSFIDINLGTVKKGSTAKTTIAGLWAATVTAPSTLFNYLPTSILTAGTKTGDTAATLGNGYPTGTSFIASNVAIDEDLDSKISPDGTSANAVSILANLTEQKLNGLTFRHLTVIRITVTVEK